MSKEYEKVGKPLVGYMEKKHGWKNQNAVTGLGAHGWDIEMRIPSQGRKVSIETKYGGTHPHSSFYTALGQIIWRTNATKYYNHIGLAWHIDDKETIMKKINTNKETWISLRKLFNCRYLFFVKDKNHVEVYSWTRLNRKW